MSRSLLRSVLELRTPMTRLPPSFLLPIRSRALTTTTQHVDPSIPPTNTPTQTSIPPRAPSPPTPNTLSRPQHQTPPAPPSAAAAATAPSTAQFLPLLRAQPNHYITILIHGRPYLVTEGDQIRLPFLMHGVLPGDVLRLTRASVLGSRDYTLRGAPLVDERLFECRATVTGVESEPLRVKVKTKRRNRRSQRVASKHRYTILRVSELKVLGPAA
ncbi:Uu.00g016040.m01.CDS01 [Anthostomella pinea]|uniref:Large ribosomal subunit protein bL21m n=1 Tax=Anthostomella pinea TaxID=933095 RepID=A0AAI8VZJ2_9PEZI|nr:Uu.00g016040.m01.CDS01 [Anthostomella pinea]